ncbi:hypothetical protein DOE59_22755 [Salmonella enterica subsp. diarizonae serovar 48:i:z]|uniref:Uncharacterized protein n=1 Tax=Salmonella enterica subsp. diarizonae serovar 48:i:z TaxID=1192842 RepID=A0A7U6BF19_SALDZ|nr:hypothetical protein DOE59_22755 [Salmonella enterica subsp. diarizonae serovar 48:i:z]EAA4453667.1 hypothetical protein [Salmonella enterica subsp. diarizonae]EAM2672736.1 hypothetical protein [Salmonella enterica]EAM6404831.1 hypothetical protein [Salmonella enterica]EAN2415265.1 hypothetical protein [Salmonella enterica]
MKQKLNNNIISIELNVLKRESNASLIVESGLLRYILKKVDRIKYYSEFENKNKINEENWTFIHSNSDINHVHTITNQA